MNNNLIYALYCPVNNIPVYVGKSTSGIDRPFQHIKEKSHSKKVNEWVSNLKKNNLNPIVVVLESDFNQDYIYSKEQYWTHRMLNDGHILLNQTNVSPVFYSTKEFDKNLEDDFLTNIRFFVKANRKIKKLTQQDLAEKAGVGIKFIRDLEQGAASSFNTGTIMKVVRLFGNFNLSLEQL
jgi:hypothetical protein